MNTFWGWVPLITVLSAAGFWFCDQVLDFEPGRVFFALISVVCLASMSGLVVALLSIEWLRYMQAWPFVPQ